MKNSMMFLIITCGIFMHTNAQELQLQEFNRLWFYPSAGLLTAYPTSQFRQTLEKDMLWGLNLDGFFIPFENARFYQPGIQVEMMFHGHRKDVWNGIEIETQGAIVNLNVANRFRMMKAFKISPYIEAAFGLRIGSTQSTYEVVDEATFLESFIFNEEDEIVTYTVREHEDYSYDLSIGAGCVFNGIINVQVKFNYGPEFNFIKKEDTVVENNTITYHPSHSDVTMIMVSLGISLEKYVNKESMATYR